MFLTLSLKWFSRNTSSTNGAMNMFNFHQTSAVKVSAEIRLNPGHAATNDAHPFSNVI
jgi:hypothetical protein